MLKLANFTLHNQTAYVWKWIKMGFNLNPVPRAATFDLDKNPSEEFIFRTTLQEVLKIRTEGYDGILIGGLSNQMAYAYIVANAVGLRVFLAKTPRERTPDGRHVFKLEGYQEMLRLGEVLKEVQVNLNFLERLGKEKNAIQNSQGSL